MANLVEELGCVLWSVFFLVPTGRGKEKDMISPIQHERVFRWLYQLSRTVSFDIKLLLLSTIDALFFKKNEGN